MPVNVNPIMAAIVEAADTLNTAPDDYINPDDGLKYCGKCHTPKEAYFPEQYRKNGLDKHPIACKCAVSYTHLDVYKRQSLGVWHLPQYFSPSSGLI